MVERLEQHDGMDVVARVLRPDLEVIEFVDTQIVHDRVLDLRSDAQRDTDALDSGVAGLNLERLHVGAELIAGHVLGGGKKTAGGAEDVHVRVEPVADVVQRDAHLGFKMRTLRELGVIPHIGGRGGRDQQQDKENSPGCHPVAPEKRPAHLRYLAQCVPARRPLAQAH